MMALLADTGDTYSDPSHTEQDADPDSGEGVPSEEDSTESEDEIGPG